MNFYFLCLYYSFCFESVRFISALLVTRLFRYNDHSPSHREGDAIRREVVKLSVQYASHACVRFALRRSHHPDTSKSSYIPPSHIRRESGSCDIRSTSYTFLRPCNTSISKLSQTPISKNKKPLLNSHPLSFSTPIIPIPF